MKLCKKLVRKSSYMLFLGFFLWILGPTLQAQEAQDTAQSTQKWRKRPGLSLRFGTYFPNLSTTLRIDSESLGQGTEIELEDILQFDRSPLIVRADAEVPIVSWFSLDLGFYAIKRSKTVVIDRDIQIGDTIFNVNQTLNGKFDTTYLRTQLKFYLLRNPKLDLGIWAGANVAFINFSVQSQKQGVTLSEEQDVWAPIPALGIHGSYTLIPNLYIFGKAGYFYYGLSDNLKFKSLSLDVNVNYFFYKSLGVGATYDYNKFELDGEFGDISGKALNKLGGFQIYFVIGF